MGREDADRLGEVDRRAAAERDQPVGLLLAIDLHGGERRLLGRVRRHVVEHEAAIVGREHLEEPVDQPRGDDALVGHDERSLDPERGEVLGQLLERAVAEADVGQVGDEGHVELVLWPAFAAP